MPPTKKPAKTRRSRGSRTAVEHWTARDRRELSDAFRALVRQNPRAASAVLDALEVVASSDRGHALRLVEAAGTVVSSVRGRS
jgi:hypothetical protein